MRKWMGLLILAAACSDDDANLDDTDAGSGSSTSSTSTTGTGTGTETSGEELLLEDLEAIQNPANPLSFFVQWRTTQPAPTRLEVDCGPDYQQTFESSDPVETHDVFVMGLYDGMACTMTASTGLDDGLSDSLEVTPGPLPADVPEFTIAEHIPEQRQPGWALFNLTNRELNVPMKLIIVDEEGRVRWYHETPEGDYGEDNDLRLISDGLLLGGTWNRIFPAIYDWEGNQIWTQQRLNHHDIRPDGDDENRLWLLSRDSDCPPVFNGLKVDSVHLTDRMLDEDVYQWNVCNHYQPPVIYDDWDHVNTVELDGEDGFIVSLRNQNNLFYVDRPSGDIIWRLGENGDFTLEGEATGDEVWFGQQHAPELQPNGNILLFDNGLNEVREWSRGVELELDMNTMAARVVWEFRPEPDIFAPIWGDADRQPNGNRVIVFGRREPGLDTQIFEVADDGTVVWHLVTPPDWGIYRAERIEPTYGYVHEATSMD